MNCPKCKHYNALLSKWIPVIGVFHDVCRDCGFDASVPNDMTDYSDRKEQIKWQQRDKDRRMAENDAVIAAEKPVLLEGSVAEFNEAAASGQVLSLCGLAQAIKRERI